MEGKKGERDREIERERERERDGEGVGEERGERKYEDPMDTEGRSSRSVAVK